MIETEHDIQRTILSYLEVHRIFHYRQNTGGFHKDYQNKIGETKKNFVKFGAKGAPDIVCVVNGRYVGIEVKGPKGKQTDDQLNFSDSLRAAGGYYILARSVEEVILAIAEIEKEK